MPVEMKITVDDSALKAAMAKVSPREVDRRQRAAMSETLEAIKTKVQEKTPVDTGNLRGGTFSEIRGTGAELRGKVAPPPNARHYAGPVEFGRKPGRMPPVDAIRAWANRHGAGHRAFLIARAIGRRGTKGHHMFKGGFEYGQRIVPGIFRKHWRL